MDSTQVIELSIPKEFKGSIEFQKAGWTVGTLKKKQNFDLEMINRFSDNYTILSTYRKAKVFCLNKARRRRR